MSNKNTVEERVKSLEERVKLLEEKLTTDLSPTTSPDIRKAKIVSEREYLLEKRPADDVQRTFYLGKYLEEHKNVEGFTVDDLRSAFRAAREPVPSNINDKINKNIAKGYFMETEPKGGKKTWVLTSTGERVANGEVI